MIETTWLTSLMDWHAKHKEHTLSGRYITLPSIEPLILDLPPDFHIENIGSSHENRPIYKISIGVGSIKVLLWTQMHGNESTGTKAVFDLFKWFVINKDQEPVKTILTKCTLVFIPMLNPDGAKLYTRFNAQDIDLNRDAVHLKAPESKLLNTVLTAFNPSFCFNLHDQRTIFSVGEKNLPATLSFLAPSVDEERTVTEGRKITMSVISAIHNALSSVLPGQIGRYTDEFYPLATGDNFQKAGHHTILIEAGHYQNDYDREKVRMFNFLALIIGIRFVTTEEKFNNYKAYFDIPNNKKEYLDIIYKNIDIESLEEKRDIGILFKEKLIGDKVEFQPTVEYIKDLSGYNANTIEDLQGKSIPNENDIDEFIAK